MMSDAFSAAALTPPSSHDLLNELKVRAKLRLKDLNSGAPDALFHARWITRRRRWPWPAAWVLTQARNIVCAELDFHDWAHARRVLEGHAAPTEDMGGLWYDLRCQLRLNHWFPDYASAKAFQLANADHYLFPFGRQFVVGDHHFVRLLGLEDQVASLTGAQRDLHASYGTPAWRALCLARLRATRGRLPIGRLPTPRNF
jgi:hypothetical protein